MLEALWSIEFQSNFGMNGNGVAVLETGRILGGDSSMLYIGSYEVNNGMIDAKIHIKQYATVSGMASVVLLDDFNFNASGQSDPNHVVLTGYVLEAPERQIIISAIRRAELP